MPNGPIANKRPPEWLGGTGIAQDRPVGEALAPQPQHVSRLVAAEPRLIQIALEPAAGQTASEPRHWQVLADLVGAAKSSDVLSVQALGDLVSGKQLRRSIDRISNSIGRFSRRSTRSPRSSRQRDRSRVNSFREYKDLRTFPNPERCCCCWAAARWDLRKCYDARCCNYY